MFSFAGCSGAGREATGSAIGGASSPTSPAVVGSDVRGTSAPSSELPDSDEFTSTPFTAKPSDARCALSPRRPDFGDFVATGSPPVRSSDPPGIIANSHSVTVDEPRPLLPLPGPRSWWFSIGTVGVRDAGVAHGDPGTGQLRTVWEWSPDCAVQTAITDTYVVGKVCPSDMSEPYPGCELVVYDDTTTSHVASWWLPPSPPDQGLFTYFVGDDVMFDTPNQLVDPTEITFTRFNLRTGTGTAWHRSTPKSCRASPVRAGPLTPLAYFNCVDGGATVLNTTTGTSLSAPAPRSFGPFRDDLFLETSNDEQVARDIATFAPQWRAARSELRDQTGIFGTERNGEPGGVPKAISGPNGLWVVCCEAVYGTFNGTISHLKPVDGNLFGEVAGQWHAEIAANRGTQYSPAATIEMLSVDDAGLWYRSHDGLHHLADP